MTVTSGFFNAVASDRLYDATQFGKIFDGLILDGVYLGVGEALVPRPTSPTTRAVLVPPGRAWFDHSWTLNDADLTLAIDAPDATYNRIDIVALETNFNTGVRANSIKIVKGTPSANPVPPTLTRSSLLNQYPLAHVLVKVGATVIIAGDITNKVGTTDCPFVTNIIQTFSINSLIAQWNSDFNGVWIPARLAEFNAWIADRDTEFDNWLLAREAEFDAWLLAQQANLREKLTATRNYYVRNDGNDANTGLVDNAGGAFLTFQKAVDVVSQLLDLNGQQVVINCTQTATFTGIINLKPCVGVNPAMPPRIYGLNFTFNAGGSKSINAENCGHWDLRGFKVTGGGGAVGVYVSGFSRINIVSMNFGACGAGHVYALDGAIVTFDGGDTISGNATYFLFVDNGKVIFAASPFLTFNPTNITFTDFIHVKNGGVLKHSSGTFVDAGSVVGQRYEVHGNGVINTVGGGANYFPGNSAGAADTGGQYI